MSQSMKEQDILDALNEATNEDTFNLMTTLIKKHKKKPYDFACELKQTFPSVDLEHPSRVKSKCEKFVLEYKNRHASAKLKAERSVCCTGYKGDFTDCYTKSICFESISFKCNICDMIFVKKHLINKHIKEHKAQEINDIVENDDELISYRNKSFSCPGIKNIEVSPAPVAKQTDLKNKIEMDKKIKQHLRHKIKTLEKDLKNANKRADDAETLSQIDLNNTTELEVMDESFIDETPPKKVFKVPSDKTVLILERSSSITSSSAFHATKLQKNNNHPSGYNHIPTLVMEIPKPRATKRANENALPSKTTKKRVVTKVDEFTNEMTGAWVYIKEVNLNMFPT